MIYVAVLQTTCRKSISFKVTKKLLLILILILGVFQNHCSNTDLVDIAQVMETEKLPPRMR